MKKIFIALLLLTLSTVAMAGVKRFTHSITAETESVLLTEVEVAIPMIQSGKIRSSFQRNCFPNNTRTIKVTTVTVKKNYSVDAYGGLKPFYTGTINYTHSRCSGR